VTDSSNVEIVRGLYQAWSGGDYAGALELIDPEIEIEARHESLHPGNYRGHRGLYDLLQDFWEQFDERRTEVMECVSVGDKVFASVLHRGRGKRTGMELEMPHWHLWTLRDGKIVGWRTFSTRTEALEAAGLASEAEAP
jgi:uncharacterized protein